MNKRYNCEECIFYKEDLYTDMHVEIPGCELNPDIWDALMPEKETEKRIKCNLYTNKKALIREYRKYWKNEQE